jgi:hypothetical protein
MNFSCTFSKMETRGIILLRPLSTWIASQRDHLNLGCKQASHFVFEAFQWTNTHLLLFTEQPELRRQPNLSTLFDLTIILGYHFRIQKTSMMHLRTTTAKMVITFSTQLATLSSILEPLVLTMEPVKRHGGLQTLNLRMILIYFCQLKLTIFDDTSSKTMSCGSQMEKSSVA